MNRVFALFLLFLTLTGFSQNYFEEKDQPEKKINLILKTNPLAALYGPIFITSEYRLCAERMTRADQSVQISASYLGKGYYVLLFESLENSSYRFVISGMRFTAEYRLYLPVFKEEKEAPSGLYMAPYMSWSSAKISDDYSITFNEYTKATYQNYCLKTGYQYIKGDFAFDFFVGMGYRNNIWTEFYNQKLTVLDNTDMELFPGNVKFLMGFNVGVCF